jgi:hypothetical protein
MTTHTPTTREQLVKHFEWQAKSCQKTLDAFASKLTVRPLDAFKWADEAMLAAARLRVAEELEAELSSETRTLEAAKAVLVQRVVQQARYANNGSTSACSNYVDRCVQAATAEALEVVSQYIAS